MKKILLLFFSMIFGFYFGQNNCSSALTVCGNSNISYNPSGPGVLEQLGPNSCINTEKFSVWYIVNVATSGTLTMSITPNQPSDYDFAIYGPNKTCGALGDPIRCSYAAGTGATGLNTTAVDLSEGASGDRWVKYLDVQAGEQYILLVNNFSENNNGFQLIWGGTATLGGPFNSNLQPNPFNPPGAAPTTPSGPYEVPICSAPAQYDFNALGNYILNGNTNFSVTWHTNSNAAILGTSPIASPYTVFANQVYYYRIVYTNPNDPTDPNNKCAIIGSIKFKLSKIKTQVTPKTLKACPPLPGAANPVWDLTSENVYTGTLDVTKSYHLTDADAQSGANPIANPQAYSSAAPKTIYVRVVENLSNCVAVTQITLEYNPSPQLQDATLSQCQNVGGPWVFDLSSAQISATPPAGVKYYPTMADAVNETNEITTANSYGINAPGVYEVYAVASSNLGCKSIAKITLKANENPPVATTTLKACSVNGTGTFNLTAANVTTFQNVTYAYYTSQANAENNTAPIQTPAAYVSGPATIFVKVTTAEGCSSIVPVTLELYPLPEINTAAYNLRPCDDNLDGKIEVDFTAVTAAMVTNANLFTVKYYLSEQDAQNASGQPLPNQWSYTAPTTVYMSVQSPNGCAPVVKALNFGFGNAVPVNTPVSKVICDEDLDGIINVDLNAFVPSFTQDTTVTPKFFATKANAQNNVNPIPGVVTVSQAGVYYIRFEKNGVCPSLGVLDIRVKTSKKSEVLKDKYICINNVTTLDAGPGFDSYEWSTGATTSSISNVPIGTYWVKLGANGCFYTQKVEVLATPDPVITEVKIENTNIEVIVSGGVPPYEYSLDGIVWQTSNVFQGLPRGENKIFVRDSNKCIPVIYDFTIVNLVNAITPNGDGINDYLDYSSLVYKKNLKIEVFDRYGTRVFSSENDKNYRWDGRYQGRPLNTGTYWYVINWNENDAAGTPVKYSGWIMIKNRD